MDSSRPRVSPTHLASFVSNLVRSLRCVSCQWFEAMKMDCRHATRTISMMQNCSCLFTSHRCEYSQQRRQLLPRRARFFAPSDVLGLLKGKRAPQRRMPNLFSTSSSQLRHFFPVNAGNQAAVLANQATCSRRRLTILSTLRPCAACFLQLLTYPGHPM